MKYLPILAFLLLSMAASATTLNCNGSQSDCQTKVNSAVDGDVVNVAAGSFTWTSQVTWTDKNITFQGQGSSSTIITCNFSGVCLNANDANKQGLRITALGFARGATPPNVFVEINSGASSTGVYGWRIDHCDFNAGAGVANAIFIHGINWGLTDHNTFEGNMNGVVVYSDVDADFNNGTGHAVAGGFGAFSWATALSLGSVNAVYVEDSTFTSGTCASQSLGVNDMEYGARIAFRHNTVSCEYIQSHSTRSFNRGGARSIEIYNNTFDGTAANFLRPSLILAGTGIIFNNTIKRYTDNNITFGDQRASQQVVGQQYWECAGSSDAHGPPTPYTWDGNVEASTGWPCLDQIGRDKGSIAFSGGYPSAPTVTGSESTVPYQLWNNGTTSTCATGGTCDQATGVDLNSNPVSLTPYISTSAHSNGDKDYCIGTSSQPIPCGNYNTSYVPLTYPHPLQGGAAATYSPTSLAYANQIVNTTSNSQTITVTSAGGANLITTAIALQTGTQYAISGGTCVLGGQTLTPGSSCTVFITFTPTTTGLKTDNLQVTSNSGGTPGNVDNLPLSGTGINPSTAATPSCSPVAGTYTGTQSVTCSSSPGAIMCYTTNGATPATNGTTGCSAGTLYSGALSVSTTTTAKIIAGGTGFLDSSVLTGTYTIIAATPVLAPAGGNYSITFTVTMTTAGPGIICYTSDGSTPATNGTTGCTAGTKYTTPVTVTFPTTTTLKAIAGGTGLTDSVVDTEVYTFNTLAYSTAGKTTAAGRTVFK